MTIETELRAFKTKLQVNEKDYPRQFSYLMRVAKACKRVRNWYVETALKKMKEDGITVFSSKEELLKYSPRELRKELTKLINSDPEWAWLKGIPSTPRTYIFEQIEKTFVGGKGKKYNFVFQCKCMAKDIKERLEKLKEKAKKEGRELTEEEIKKATVFFNNKKPYEPDNLYKVKGFPRFIQDIRHISFPIDGVTIDGKNKCVVLPTSSGNKKFNVPKMESVKIFYHDHDLNPEGIDKSAIFTFSYDGQDWWMSVKQIVEVAKIPAGKESEVLGIDLGLKTTAYLSNGQKIKNITEDKSIKEWEKRKKYLDALRKKNLEKSPIEKIKTPRGKMVKPKSAKYKKLTKHIQILDNKITRYKDTLVKQQVASIDLSNVKGIVFEDFKIESMKHNKKWSGKVQNSCIGITRRAIINKAKVLGIPIMKAPKSFPSTQVCSNCGERNLHMRKNLKERTFKCEFCGHTLNRDLNASINLAKKWGSPDLVPYDK